MDNKIGQSGRGKPNRFGFYVLIVVLIVPACAYILINTFGKHHCKSLMILRDEASGEDSLPHYIPPFEFKNQYGETFTRDSLGNGFTVVDFVFTTCKGICIPLSKKFAILQEDLKSVKHVKLLSISVDPVTDSVPALAEYAKKYGAIKGKWNFLTGNEKEIVKIVMHGFKQPHFIDPAGIEKVTHSDRTVLIDKDFRIRGFYQLIDNDYGSQEYKRLLEEINVLTCEYQEKADKEKNGEL